MEHIYRANKSTLPPPAFLPQCQPVNSSYLIVHFSHPGCSVSIILDYILRIDHPCIKTKGSCATSLTRFMCHIAHQSNTVQL